MNKFQIEESEQCREYMRTKGLQMFEDLAPNLEKYKQYLDKNDQDQKDDIKITRGEKFVINEDHDFKEWEHYDILHHRSSKQGSIDVNHMPDYIQKDIE
jgi:hypothetical protein